MRKQAQSPSASACEGPAFKASMLADARAIVCLLFAIMRGASQLISEPVVQGFVEQPSVSDDSAKEELPQTFYVCPSSDKSGFKHFSTALKALHDHSNVAFYNTDVLYGGVSVELIPACARKRTGFGRD